jgi:hypothetical protein
MKPSVRHRKSPNSTQKRDVPEMSLLFWQGLSALAGRPRPRERNERVQKEESVMTQIRKLLIGTALTTLCAAAFAQTGVQSNPPSAPSAPAAAGVDVPRQTPDIAGLRDEPPSPQDARHAPAPQPLAAPGPTDPLAQKRDEDARANAEYRQDKQSARTEYKGHVKSAKAQRKADRDAANDQMKEQMHGAAAQSQGGDQRP